MLTVPSVPPVTTRAGALVLRVEHWTPKGDYTERGVKERYRNESNQMKKLPKKCSPKNVNHLQFHIIKMNEKKINKILILQLNFILEIPL